PLPVPAGHIAVYASEALADLWGATPGQTLPKFSKAFMPLTQTGKAPAAPFFVAGVWRDYARQSGALVMDAQDYTRLTGDARANDLALWPRAGAEVAQLQQAITALAGEAAAAAATAATGGTGAIGATEAIEAVEAVEAVGAAGAVGAPPATLSETAPAEATANAAPAALLEFAASGAIRARS